ncbi:MAG: T9SS type A sorting domain-containing protein [Bacteroidia bacterium]|nr:T9SS type A sorting domain-containing protein [Bacteroidia bacterium]
MSPLKLRQIIIGTVLLALTQFAFGQVSLSNRGTDFWMAFTANLCSNASTCSGNNIEFNITSTSNTSGTITSLAGLNIPFTVTAGLMTNITIPSSYVVFEQQQVVNRAIHITANDTINLNAANFKVGSSDGTMLLSTGSLGTDYRVMTYQGNLSYPSSFIIVGAQNGTTVTITPSLITSAGNPAGTPFNVTLNQGEAYMVHSQSAANADLTGSTITSNFPVAVFGSSQCTNVPTNVTYCDMLYEQQIPTIAWGNEFVTGRLMGRSGGDFFRVMAHSSGTQVKVNGVTVANLNAGGRYDAVLNNGNWITANNPIAVSQYSRGRTADGTPSSDPFMIQLVPVIRYGNNYQFATSSPSVTATSHITITSKTANTGLVRLDGAAVGGWATCGASGWSYTLANITPGAHSLTSDSLCGAVVYGWGNTGTSTSYGYYVGTDVPISTILPVKFLDFHGSFERDHNLLEWGVKEQAHNSYYLLQRSNDHEDWKDLARVNAGGKSAYSFRDPDLEWNSTYYYRVIAFDQNGKSEKSSVIAITTGYLSNHIAISPNPFSDQLKVEFYLDQAEKVTLQVLDITGKMVYEGSTEAEAGLQNWILQNEIHDLKAGAYLVRLTVGGRQIQSKVVKF